MSVIFWLFSVVVAWACGSLRIPQRWIPMNPIIAAMEAEKKARERQLISQMFSAKQPAEPQPAPTPLVK